MSEIDLNAVESIRNRGAYKSGDLEQLLDWLSRTKSVHEKRAIVRALSLPGARPRAISALLYEYRNAPYTENSGLKWVIANAFDVIADESALSEIIDFIHDYKNGKSREMLVSSLGNINNNFALNVLLESLSDDALAGHAIMGLGRLGRADTAEAIRPFLGHPKAWVRKEAGKALRRIEKLHPSK